MLLAGSYVTTVAEIEDYVRMRIYNMIDCRELRMHFNVFHFLKHLRKGTYGPLGSHDGRESKILAKLSDAIIYIHVYLVWSWMSLLV